MAAVPNSIEFESQISIKISEILTEKLKYTNVENVTVKVPDELKGEHFATETVYVKVKFSDGKVKNLFLKIPSHNEVHQKLMREVKVMEKECAFYNDFLPFAQKFCESRGCANIFNFFPSCLYADDDMILLENLVLDYGYKMLPKSELQDFDSAKLVIENLARFHAVSYAMIEDKGLEEFKKRWALTAEDKLSKHEFMESMFAKSPNFALSILENSKVSDDNEAVQFLKVYSQTVAGRHGKILDNSRQAKLVTLTHGDCWNNNMLFKVDEKTGIVLENVLVDMLASPVIDITNFLFSSVKSHVRETSHQPFIQIYVDEFNKTLKSLNASCFITVQEFEGDYTRFCEHGLLMGLLALSAIGAMEGLDFDMMESEEADGIDAFSSNVEKWITNNPDKTGKIAIEIISLVKEYKQLIANESR